MDFDNDAIKRYLDAATAFGQTTKARAEELLKGGEAQRKEAHAKVENVVERGRKSSEALIAIVRAEVGSQLKAKGISSIEDLATHVATLLGRSSGPGASPGSARPGTEPEPGSGTVQATGEKAPTAAEPDGAGKAAGKAPAKKATAKKAPAKKAAPKKAAAKKAGAKKAASPSPAKKAGAKKAAAAESAPTPGSPD